MKHRDLAPQAVLADRAFACLVEADTLAEPLDVESDERMYWTRVLVATVRTGAHRYRV